MRTEDNHLVGVRGMTGLFCIDKTREELQQVDKAFAAYGELVERAALRSLSEGGHPNVEAMARELATIVFEDDPTGAAIVPKDVGVLSAAHLVDAFHTTALGAANTVYALPHHPDALAAVKTRPTCSRPRSSKPFASSSQFFSWVYM